MSRYTDPPLFEYVEDGRIDRIRAFLERDTVLTEDGFYHIDDLDGRTGKYNALDVALQVNTRNVEEVIRLLLDEGIYINDSTIAYAKDHKDMYDRWGYGTADRIIELLEEAKAQGEERERIALLRRRAEEEEEDEGAAIRQAEEEFDAIQAEAAQRVAENTSEANIARVANEPAAPEEGVENPPGAEEEPQPTPPKGGRKTRKRKTKKRTTRKRITRKKRSRRNVA